MRWLIRWVRRRRQPPPARPTLFTAATPPAAGAPARRPDAPAVTVHDERLGRAGTAKRAFTPSEAVALARDGRAAPDHPTEL